MDFTGCQSDNGLISSYNTLQLLCNYMQYNLLMNSVIDMGDNQEAIYLPVRSFVGQNHYTGG